LVVSEDTPPHAADTTEQGVCGNKASVGLYNEETGEGVSRKGIDEKGKGREGIDERNRREGESRKEVSKKRKEKGESDRDK
jgi:hypothetical protein